MIDFLNLRFNFIYKEPNTIFEGWKKVNYSIKTETNQLYLSLLLKIEC